MKKYNIAALVLVTMVSLQSLVYSMEGFEIIEEEPAVQEKALHTKEINSDFDFLDFWDKHGTGTIGGYTINGEVSTKHLYFLNLGVNYEWSIMKFYLETSFLNSETSYSHQDEHNNTKLILKRDKFLVRNAYVDFSLTDNLNLAVGRQTVTFGQFDIFSPIDFVLPIEFDLAGGQGYGKTVNRRPQDTAKLAWFPLENLELSGYYFPNYENMFFDNSYFSDNGGLELPSSSKDHQYALRALYYHDFATVGVTYYEGWNYFFPTQESTLVGDNVVDGAFKVRPNKMIGFEMSKPIGSFVWKFEVAKSIQTTQLDKPSKYYYTDDFGYNRRYSFSASKESYDNYVSWIKNKNNNSLNIESDIYFYALGFDADLDRWKLNVAAIMVETKYSGKNKEGFDLAEKNSSSSYQDDGNNQSSVIPTLLIRYYFNDEQTSHMGLGAGWMGGYAGAELYYAHEFMESLSLMIGYQVGLYFSDAQQSSQESNDDDDDDDNNNYNLSTNGVRFGLLYKF